MTTADTTTQRSTKHSGPGAPFASDHSSAAKPKKLRGISDIRRFFYRNSTPIYFISATNINLLGMDEWIRRFTFINFIDSFDGSHPNVFVPPLTAHDPFTSIEDINNYLLSHKAVIDFIKQRGPSGKAVFLMFDEKTEQLCEELGLEVCFPSAALRSKIDDKMETTRIANRAGVECVPNILAPIKSWEDLRAKTKELGDHLVVQTAYGDSGHTTFFISSEDDWKKHADEIIEAPEVKVMKRIRCRGSAIEACATQHGTIVGPLMTELVGFPELTPYRGGWCGNEVFPEAFPEKVRQVARKAAFAFGEELRKLGYKGYFELDFLTDLDNDRVYLGECNPRITGASSMTNLASFCHADAPLFLFHLIEWMGVEYDIDVNELNERWADADNIDSWSQLVIKHTEDSVDHVVAAPATGIWEMNPDGSIRHVRGQTHRRTVQYEHRAFYHRITGVGDYRYEGADLGILVSPGRFMTDDFELNDRAKAWIAGLRAEYVGQPIAANAPAHQAIESGGFKVL